MNYAKKKALKIKELCRKVNKSQEMIQISRIFVDLINVQEG